MKRVIVESPYRGEGYTNLELNLKYARFCLRDCLLRGEAPFASHLLYTQEGVLDDQNSIERSLGIEAGLHWGKVANLTAAYIDLIDEWKHYVGVVKGIKRAYREHRPVEFRNLPDEVLIRLDSSILIRRKPPEILIRELHDFLKFLKF